MARSIRITPLESYVKDYLKSHHTKYKSNIDMLRKAAVYIEQKIATNCCDPDNPVVNLFTRKDNTFVHTVWTILQGMSRKDHIQSLTRAYNAIQDYITPPCCFENSTVFALTGPTGTVHEPTTSYAFVATATVTGPYAADIAHIDTYVDGVLKSVSIVNPASYSTAITIPASSTLPASTYYFIAYSNSGVAVQSASRTYTLTNP